MRSIGSITFFNMKYTKFVPFIHVLNAQVVARKTNYPPSVIFNGC